MATSKKPRRNVSTKPRKTKRNSAPLVFLDEDAIDFLMSLVQEEDDPLGQAQEIMYDAWEANGRRKRVALAKRALTVSPLCADAYVLLAHEEAKTPEEALSLFRNGVEAGKGALGPTGFKEYAGHFWGSLETRPYMRAMQGLAHTLDELGQHREAVEVYEEMLKLNPNDNQGNRYLLAEILLAHGKIQPLTKLIGKYKDDASAHWLYTQALLAFRDKSPKANELAMEAWQVNSHVPDMLSGERPPVLSDSGYLTVGGDDEASAYVEANGIAWRSTSGAIQWLKDITGGLKPPKWHRRLADN